MAHSFSRNVEQKTGRITHTLSGTTFEINRRGNNTEVTMTRDGATVTHPAAFTIGSGNHALGYLIESGDHLFQAPISYYAKRRIWDMAPGYESNTAPDFFRPITAECLQCHAGHVAPIPGTLNRTRQFLLPTSLSLVTAATAIHRRT